MTTDPGDKVRVIGGPYTGWVGEVLRVEGERVVVVIPVFARPTAVDLLPSEIAAVG